MIKKISEMTAEDKAKFLEGVKRSMLQERGVPWETIEPLILDEIDAAFDDERFLKMDPDSQIDAVHARKEFGKKKPSLADYLLWTTKFVTGSEYAEF